MLIQNKIVDEYRLMIFPIILRRGKRLFKEEIASVSLRLLEAKPLGPEDVIVITYMRKEKNGE